MEGAAELETLVLCWHGDAEPREALGVQVGLHARRHAVGALEASPPATQGVTAGPEPSSHTEHRMQMPFSNHVFRLINAQFYGSRDSHAVTAVTTTHSVVISPAKSSGI